jgi:hypothetical protein
LPGSCCLLNAAFRCYNMKEVLETDGRDDCTAIWMYLMTLKLNGTSNG